MTEHEKRKLILFYINGTWLERAISKAEMNHNSKEWIRLNKIQDKHTKAVSNYIWQKLK